MLRAHRLGTWTDYKDIISKIHFPLDEFYFNVFLKYVNKKYNY